MPTDKDYLDAFEEEADETSHVSMRTPKLPSKMWSKMNEDQRKVWAEEVRRYMESLEEEGRNRAKRKRGY